MLQDLDTGLLLFAFSKADIFPKFKTDTKKSRGNRGMVPEKNYPHHMDRKENE